MVPSAWGLLSGCTGPAYSYSKPGADAAEFRQDSYACVQERQASKLYRLCMEANGWRAEAPR